MTDASLPRCFVHIGAPKTGTTYLQNMCARNRAALRAANIFYPQTGERRGGHHDFAFLIADGYPEWATPQPRTLGELEADLSAELRSAPRSSVLFSSEDFYMFPRPEELRALLQRTGALKNREPVIVVYIRRQDAAHESWYNQTIKALGYHHTVQESVERFDEWWDYDANLSRWASVFGETALMVRVYEEAQFVGGTLASDFLTVLGAAGARLDLPQERVNTGLNYDLLEMQRCINRLPFSAQEKRRFHKQMIELSVRSSGMGLFDEAPLIEASLAASIRERYAAGNRNVAARFFKRERLFFEESVTIAHDEAKTRTGITAEKMLYVLGWILSRHD